MGLLGTVLWSMLARGYTAIVTTEIQLTLRFAEPITPHNTERRLSGPQFQPLVAGALHEKCAFLTDRLSQKEALRLISWGSQDQVRSHLKRVWREGTQEVSAVTLWVLAADEADGYHKARRSLGAFNPDRLSLTQARVMDHLIKNGQVRLAFNTRLFTNGDSANPELAGLWSAFCGSVWTLCVALMVGLPLGLGSAFYLGELAPQKAWVRWATLKTNNLASTPPIIFGLLGFALFDRLLEVARPSALLGGLTIGLMMGPVIMVTTRVALEGVPSSMRQAAYALGATKAEVLMHHVLPYAIPRVVTGALVTMTRMLGETAPVLMVGMVAFVPDAPHSVTAPATTLPAQIFSWAKSAEWGFSTKTTGGVLALLFLIGMMNMGVFLLRKHWDTEK